MGTALAVFCYVIGIPIGILGFILLSFGLYVLFGGGTFVDVIVAPQFGILGFLIMVGAIVLMWAGNRTRRK